jgi:ABC-type glycerol-3-phosphate transport system substrate-binding protein
VLQIGLSKLRTYADSGALLTLDDAALSGHENLAASNFVDGVAGDATAIGGKVVSVPWVSDTRVLFYRRRHPPGSGYQHSAGDLGSAARRREDTGRPR